MLIAKKANFRESSCATWKTQEIERKTKSSEFVQERDLRLQQMREAIKRPISNETLQKISKRLNNATERYATKKSSETYPERFQKTKITAGKI
jgi:hypothetical protein